MSQPLEITVNGKDREIPAGTTVSTLLAELGVKGRVAVERNQDIVPRAEHAHVELEHGDVIEVVTFVGGG